MKKFSIGFVIGLLLGGAVPAFAMSTGYLFGWTVTKDGEEVCDAPFIWPTLREIECD